MKNISRLILCSTLIVQSVFSLSEEDFIQALSSPQEWARKKNIFNNKLKNKTIFTTRLKIKNRTFKDFDFSEIKWENFHFINCIFINVNLKNSDLTHTIFTNTTFEDVKLDGAILCEGLEFDDSKSPLELVQQYSELNLQEQVKIEEIQSTSSAHIFNLGIEDYYKKKEEIELNFLKKIKALNNILGVLSLDLTQQNLTGLNLNYINLNHANLEGADLTGVNLCGASLQNSNLKNTNFQNANLSCVNLSGASLESANLQQAMLTAANLRNTNLTDVILKNACLEYAQLEGARLSEKLIILNDKYYHIFFEKWDTGLPEEQKLIQKLVSAQLEIFRYIPNERLRKVKWQEKDLRNANFTGAQLQRVNFKNTNLENAIFMLSNLEEVSFINANLTNTTLLCCYLRGTLIFLKKELKAVIKISPSYSFSLY